jgi:putative colanic acid biosynthesis acetyltransferase WcaF
MTRVRLQDFRGDDLDRGRPLMFEVIWHLTKMFFFLSAFPWPSSFKAALLRLFGANVGYGCVIKPRVNIHFPWKLNIGNHVWIGEEVFILNFEPISIGSQSCISQRAFLCGGNHDYRDPAMRYRNGPITIGEGVWIGAGVFICPDITIATEAIVRALSVVNKDLAAGMIYSGNPCIAVGERWKIRPSESDPTLNS